MDVLQPGKVADIQVEPVRPQMCDIPPTQVVHVYGVRLRRWPPFSSATVYVLNVEDKMVWLRNCRRYKVRQRGDDACIVVALVPLWLIRMLERVRVEVKGPIHTRTTDAMIFRVPMLEKILTTLFPFAEVLDWELNYQLTRHSSVSLWLDPPIIRQGSGKEYETTL